VAPRIRVRDLIEILAHQESDGEDLVFVFVGEDREVRLVIGGRFRLQNLHVRTEPRFRFLQARVGGVVERLVAEAADVRHHREFERRFAARARGLAFRRRRRGRFAAGRPGREQSEDQRAPEERGHAAIRHGLGFTVRAGGAPSSDRDGRGDRQARRRFADRRFRRWKRRFFDRRGGRRRR
jgi:hypothetical protein